MLIRTVDDETDLPEPKSVGEIKVCQASNDKSLRQSKLRQNKAKTWRSATHSSTEHEDERDYSESDLKSCISIRKRDQTDQYSILTLYFS